MIPTVRNIKENTIVFFIFASLVFPFLSLQIVKFSTTSRRPVRADLSEIPENVAFPCRLLESIFMIAITVPRESFMR